MLCMFHYLLDDMHMSNKCHWKQPIVKPGDAFWIRNFRWLKHWVIHLMLQNAARWVHVTCCMEMTHTAHISSMHIHLALCPVDLRLMNCMQRLVNYIQRLATYKHMHSASDKDRSLYIKVGIRTRGLSRSINSYILGSLNRSPMYVNLYMKG